jgi:hypothetical protein
MKKERSLRILRLCHFASAVCTAKKIMPSSAFCSVVGCGLRRAISMGAGLLEAQSPISVRRLLVVFDRVDFQIHHRA